MLGQVRFPTDLRIADLQLLGAFQHAIRADWPNFEQEHQFTIVLGAQGVQQAGSGGVFRFSAGDRSWSAVLTPESITLEAGIETAGYSSYEEFDQRFRSLWTALVEHFEPTAVLQQGLRYVNHIVREIPAEGWSELINPELLGPAATLLSANLVQALCDLRFERERDALVFKHGITTAGPENHLGYLLDFDCFTQERCEDTEAEALAKRFTESHDEIYAFFRWCVTEQALQEFRGER
jgi:uncharacterized protein (TIGR04255 family)